MTKTRQPPFTDTENGSPMAPIWVSLFLPVCMCVFVLVDVCVYAESQVFAFSFTHTESHHVSFGFFLHCCLSLFLSHCLYLCACLVEAATTSACTHVIYELQFTCDCYSEPKQRTKKKRKINGRRFFYIYIFFLLFYRCVCYAHRWLCLFIVWLFAMAPNTLHFDGVMIVTAIAAELLFQLLLLLLMVVSHASIASYRTMSFA